MTEVAGGTTRRTGKKAANKHALQTRVVPVDANSVGSRWTVQDFDRLAGLIGLIAMGQALHAGKIIEELAPASPAITAASLTQAAKQQLQIDGVTDDQKDASRWRRDGFLFEARCRNRSADIGTQAAARRGALSDRL